MLSVAAFSAWNQSVGDAISEIGRPNFGHKLGVALDGIFRFDALCIWAYGADDKVVNVFDTFDEVHRATHMSKYASDFFRLDPFYQAIRQSRFNEVISGHDAWSGCSSDRYYNDHFRAAGLDDELGFGIQLDRGTTLSISLLRRQDRGLFGTRDANTLSSILPTLTALAHRQWAEMSIDLPVHAEQGASDIALTQREREISDLIIRGFSSEAIALELEISIGTVKVHRKNLYRKLRISTQGELFHLRLAPPRPN